MRGEALRVEVLHEPSQGRSAGYPVLIGARIIEDLPDLLTEHAPAYRYAIISDTTVAGLHGARAESALRGAGLDVSVFDFPPGEENKTREEWSRLSDRLLEERFGRDSVLIALGGGVTGDLAGFVAATYMRGIPLVQVPTSLLAMVDSSVGGKTGVDTPAGKNLIGAFHSPALVMADTSLLSTLPPEQLRSGLAEAVKHGAIADAEHLEELSGAAAALTAAEPGPLARVVERSVRIKAGVVSRDPFEGGERKILNYGHTLGHALETLSGYTILHGEAVAIGMVLEARVGESIGLTAEGTTERIAGVLRRLGLPTVPPTGIGAEAVIETTLLDKKARAGRVEYSLLTEPGRAAPPFEVAAEVVRRVLREAGMG
jgi:3-dehydroquinate synthase